jgi:hypothetical protein
MFALFGTARPNKALQLTARQRDAQVILFHDLEG